MPKCTFTYSVIHQLKFVEAKRVLNKKSTAPPLGELTEGYFGVGGEKTSVELAITRVMRILKKQCGMLWEYTCWSPPLESGKSLTWYSPVMEKDQYAPPTFVDEEVEIQRAWVTSERCTPVRWRSQDLHLGLLVPSFMLYPVEKTCRGNISL